MRFIHNEEGFCADYLSTSILIKSIPQNTSELYYTFKNLNFTTKHGDSTIYGQSNLQNFFKIIRIPRLSIDVFSHKETRKNFLKYFVADTPYGPVTMDDIYRLNQ